MIGQEYIFFPEADGWGYGVSQCIAEIAYL